MFIIFRNLKDLEINNISFKANNEDNAELKMAYQGLICAVLCVQQQVCGNISRCTEDFATITFSVIIFCDLEVNSSSVEILCAINLSLWADLPMAQRVTTSIALGSLNYGASGSQLRLSVGLLVVDSALSCSSIEHRCKIGRQHDQQKTSYWT